LPFFQMKAKVQIENQGKLIDGSYQLLWNGPEQWKEQIEFPGYTEVQVGGKGVIWVQRSTDFYPLRIYDLHAALGFGSGVAIAGAASGSLVQSGLPKRVTVTKVRERKEHGEVLTCAEYENELKHSSEICVNESANMLVRSPQSFLERDIQPVAGGRVYPRLLAFLEEGQTVAKANVTGFTISNKFPSDSFTPPPGLSPQAGCMNPLPFRQVKKLSPEYPRRAIEQHIQGIVAVDAWIGLDGVPRIGKVVERASAELEQSSVNAIKEWRYEPANCNGKPVEIETILQVKYTLSR
jgi:TonB family protein